VKKYLVTALKIGVSLAILGYLFWAATRGEQARAAMGALLAKLPETLARPQGWGLLAASLGLCALGVTLTLVRWCYLVRAVGIRLPMHDAMRIGWISYVFNFLPTGILGGDVLKAVMLAHERPGNRTTSAASVVVDRIVGLYMLFVLAAVCIFVTGFWDLENPKVHWTCIGVLGLVAVSSVGIAIVLLPGVLESRWVAALGRLRRIGPVIERLVEAMQMYRRNGPVLIWGSVASIVLQLVFTASMWLAARGLGFDVSFRVLLAVYPVAGIASTIPLPAGPFESGIVFLYPAAVGVQMGTPEWLAVEQQALIVALTYRLVTMLITPIGLGYYLAGRREVAEVIHEVEEEEGKGN
jgi:uncharacterized protein (TIRG00374 family)